MKWKNKLAAKQFCLKKNIENYNQEIKNIRYKECETGCSDTFNEQAAIFGLNMSTIEYQSLNKPIYIGDTTFIRANKNMISNELAQLLSEINNKNYVYEETDDKESNRKIFKLVNEDNNDDVFLLPDLENIEFSLQTSAYYPDVLEINIADYDKIADSKYTIVGAYKDGVARLNYSAIMAFITTLNIERFLLERDLNEKEVFKIRSKFIKFCEEDRDFHYTKFEDSFFDLEDEKVFQKNIEK